MTHWGVLSFPSMIIRPIRQPEASATTSGLENWTQIRSIETSMGALRLAARSERMLDAEPELPRRGRVDGLGDIEAERGALDKAKDSHVHPQAHSQRMGHIADNAAV